MAITEITKETLGKTKSGWRWDRKRKLFVTWEVVTTYLGKRHKRRGFRTEQDAKDYLHDLKLKERAEEVGLIVPQEFPLASELFAKRLKDIDKPQEKTRARRVFELFEKICGDKKINEYLKSDFKAFADFRLSQGVSKKTVNREINPISKAFSAAPDYFNLSNWMRPQIFKFKVSRTGRKRIVSLQEYKNFLGYFNQPRFEPHEKDYIARKRTALIFQMLAMTGLRHGEVCGMEKSKLDAARREIDVFRFKTERWKIFSPLTDTHLELLAEGEKLLPDSKFFFSESGKIHNKTYQIIEKACDKIGIEYGKEKENGFVLHDLRHTFTSLLHENLIDNQTTVEFTDNPSAVQNYQHSTFEAKKRAMAIIEDFYGIEKEKINLREIFDRIKNGAMEFEEFEKIFD